VLVLVRRPDDAVHVLLRGQRHRPGHPRAGTGDRVHDLPCRAVNDLVVIRLEPDADLLSRHVASLSFASCAARCCLLARGPGALAIALCERQGSPGIRALHHLTIFVTRPEPTVRPPSRIANSRPSSMAMGWIRSTFISVLSPGMTISVPSGR